MAALGSLLVSTFASAALADKVLVLPFAPATTARQATRAAVTQRGHTLPSDPEAAAGERAVKDGVADTSDEYRAAGRASGASWTLSGRADPRPAGYRLELEACQVGSGRVESLAREIDGAQAEAQIAEMLALLLRPEGVAEAEIPWAKAAAPPLPGETPSAATPAAPTVVETTAPPPAPAPSAPARRYAEGLPFGIAGGLELMSAFSRPEGALGTPTSLLLHGALGYALPVPGLELRADVAGAVTGPRAMWLDVGARQVFVVAPGPGVYLGPELALGAFLPLGASSARFLLRGAGVVGVPLAERLQLEGTLDLAWAPGSGGSILLGGGGARLWVRF